MERYLLNDVSDQLVFIGTDGHLLHPSNLHLALSAEETGQQWSIVSPCVCSAY